MSCGTLDGCDQSEWGKAAMNLRAGLAIGLCAVFVQGCLVPGGGVTGVPRRLQSLPDAPRVRKDYFQTKDQDLSEFYAYEDPLDADHYGNVFRMASGSVLSITLSAKSKLGNYAGDEIQVTDLTDLSRVRVQTFPFDTVDRFGNSHIAIGFANGRDGDSVVLVGDGESSAKIAVTSLYRWRIRKATKDETVGARQFKRMTAHGRLAGNIYWIGYLLFPRESALAYLDPAASRQDLCPKYVVPMNKSEGGRSVLLGDQLPIGDSGYVYVWEDGHMQVRLAK